jgi:PTS system nitrogen regulatory IIA component
MPFENMDIQQVSAYLGMDEREVARLASRGKLPCQKRKAGFVFFKGEIDHWVETQLHELPDARLAQIEQGVRNHHGMSEARLIISSLLPDSGIIDPLRARSRAGVLSDLVDAADACGLIFSRAELLEALMQREEMASTAILPQTALPHPRHPVPYDIARSFVVIGHSHAGVPFSARDGSLTRLFFLICCKDERTHLHVLARLGRVLQGDTIENLLAADSPSDLRRILIDAERAAVRAA